MMKKKFVTPSVVQQVQICLENDLLARSTDITATSDGQYFENTDYTEDDQDWASE